MPVLQIFKNKAFTRFADDNELTDADLCEVVRRARNGQINANLGGGVIKQRIARKGGGKSGGFRAIVLFRQDDLAVFVHAFPKSNQSNLKKKDLKAFKELADIMLNLTKVDLENVLENGTIIEVICDD